MNLLPKSEWTFAQESGDSIIVGAHEHDGYLWHTKFMLSDLPNDLISLDDLERLGIKTIDGRTVAEPERLCMARPEGSHGGQV